MNYTQIMNYNASEKIQQSLVKTRQKVLNMQDIIKTYGVMNDSIDNMLITPDTMVFIHVNFQNNRVAPKNVENFIKAIEIIKSKKSMFDKDKKYIAIYLSKDQLTNDIINAFDYENKKNSTHYNVLNNTSMEVLVKQLRLLLHSYSIYFLHKDGDAHMLDSF
jgi:hypothetical protein